ncbi:MAG: ABC-type transport auxiliary lipoprotein family protein [Parvibaculum sp.]|nr:ABC-type transport auxiliary lipoprotein family protein [Parvibaculum sp.]
MKSFLNFACLVALGAALSGCALANVASEPAPQLFTLTAAPMAAVALPADSASKSVSILVDEFAASAALNTARIAFQPNPNELKYYAGARWADLAPLMIQALTVETLQSSGAFASVAARGTEIRGDFILKGDVRQFAAETAGETTQVRVALFIRIVSRTDHSVLASKSFEAVTPLEGRGMESVVGAAQKSLSAVLTEVTLWSVDEVSKKSAAVTGR